MSADRRQLIDRRRPPRGGRLTLLGAATATALVVALCAAQPGRSQDAPVRSIVEAAADALGMVRGVQRRMTSINTVQFSGTGTMRMPGGDWSEFDLASLTVGISYFIPAMRWDMERMGPDGRTERLIHVVRGARAWDEIEPGVGATPVAGRAAGERRRQIWLTPHGLVRAAVDALTRDPGTVSVESQDGRVRLTVDVDGTPVTATLNDDSRPERVEMPIDHPTLGDTLLEATYSDYRDWPLLDVYFPSRIVHRLDGETVLDLTVTEFFQNPYVVFPTPEQLSRSSP